MADSILCPICIDTKIDRSAYSYLLGLYLGDGCLSRQSQRSWKLRIVQDATYPGLVSLCAKAMASVIEPDRIRYVDRKTFVEIHSSSRHWLCLFPQHGPGPKHTRQIALTGWQLQQLEGHERELVSGLIHADGSFHINSVIRPTTAGNKRYNYTRYQFMNRSDEIRRIFTDALDTLDVRWTSGGHMTVSVARRKDVAFLRTFVANKD